MRRGRMFYSGVGLALLILLTLGPGGALGEVLPEKKPPEEVTEETKPEELPFVPERERPGYFPTILFPTYYGIVQAGPVTGLLAPYGNPFAFDGLRRGWITHGLGPVLVTPYLEYDAMYRSNIFLTPTNKKSDFVSTVIPGLHFELPFAGLHRMSVGYLGSYWIYAANNEESHYDHNINVDAQFNFRGGLSLRLGNAVRVATEERQGDIARQRDFVRDTPYFLASYNVSDKWKIQGVYQYDIYEYNSAIDRFNSYREHLAGLLFFYKFMPRTSALGGYGFSSRDYPSFSQDDNIKHSPFIGITWDPTAKLTGTVKFGYTFTNYRNDVPGRDNNPSDWALSLGAIYRYSRATTFNLSVQRSVQEDTSFNNQAFVSTAVWASLNHDWTYLRAATYISFAYANADYISSENDPTIGQRRKDNLYSIGAGISRPFTRWMRLRLDYNFTERSSDLSAFSYNEHRVLFGVQLSL